MRGEVPNQTAWKVLRLGQGMMVAFDMTRCHPVGRSLVKASMVVKKAEAKGRAHQQPGCEHLEVSPTDIFYPWEASSGLTSFRAKFSLL